MFGAMKGGVFVLVYFKYQVFNNYFEKSHTAPLIAVALMFDKLLFSPLLLDISSLMLRRLQKRKF